jgi:hypothetical protein
MGKHAKLGIGVLATLVVAVALLVALTRRRSVTPATAIYRGYLSADRTNLTFWVSNPTPRMVVIDFGAIEAHDATKARDATNWRRCPLWTDKASPIPQIDSLLSVPPYTATQKQVTVTTPIDPSSWRLNAVEAEALDGPERYYVELRWHYKSKVALTTNSFAKSGTWLGYHRQVIIKETGGVSE